MRFLNREQEIQRLDQLARSPTGGLAIVYGRRRIGKTRLLLEWVRKHKGLYFVADRSTPDIQRAYFAQAVASVVPGFDDVAYPHWRALLGRLARDVRGIGWRGPIVFDELPYLVLTSPELPSVLQRWLDHEAKDAALAVAIAGSSQRMMQGLVLGSESPLFGRATEILPILPLHPRLLPQAFATHDPHQIVQLFCCWGGVPRYWELAAPPRHLPPTNSCVSSSIP